MESALDAMAAHTDIAIVVVFGDNTATGVRQSLDSTVEQNMGLDGGETISEVTVKADDMPAPEHGDAIKVDGSRVYVRGVRLDPAGALRTIEYSTTRPVAFENL